MFGKMLWAIVLAFGASTMVAGSALAGSPEDTVLPAPGVIGLIAIGVIGAIAYARARK